ncbi:hypothetical protein BH10ACT11_BH10ACT11_14020 [soil metagenome]
MADKPDPDRAPSLDQETGWPVAFLTLGAVALLAVAVLAIHPLRDAAGYAIQGDTSGLRSHLEGLGIGSVAILAGLMLVHTFVWYPAEIVDAAAGFVYGFWVALPLVIVGWVLQGLIAYSIGRNAARPLLVRMIGRDRFGRVETMIADGGPTLLIGARMVPIIPFSLFSYVAGATGVPVFRFAWTTAVGYVPITAMFIYVGSKLETLSPGDPTVWIVAIAMLALLLLTSKLRPRVEAKAVVSAVVDPVDPIEHTQPGHP